MQAIVFDGVSYVYPSGVRALKDVSFTVERGELVVLMGENGSGKTTILKHLNGLLKPTSGKVFVDGLDTSKYTVAQLATHAGLVFQNAENMFFESTVWDEVAFALKNFGYSDDVVRKRVDWALRFFDLERYAGQSPFTLSGGEKKRLAFAVVLAWSPPIIALDEPTIGQDSLQKEKMLHMIRLLNTQGHTVIMASHDVEFVADLRPRIIAISSGSIVADGPADEILPDTEILRRCSLHPPQLALLMARLRDLGMPRKLVDVDTAARLLVERLRP
ncbi:Energy-coupling factor transporter ATP-binding protein EcfA2 [archaeon HR01]|nr:Energy-coupling factor transporter ATP-binding protein EcfA2 [archaeon HR01]